MQFSSDTPRISVIVPVFNAARYLCDAVDSILNQTFRDFELLLIDDGSTDDSLAIARSYDDLRVHVIERPHEGLVATLNAGLNEARGEYIARMDADDISLLQRFQKQVDFLDENPDVGVVGVSWRGISLTGVALNNVYPPQDHDGIVERFHTIEDYMNHPTVMMRADIPRRIGGYRPEFVHAEDLDFLTRASEVTRLANLPEVLFLFRRHLESISARYWFEQERSAFIALYAWEQRKAGRDENLDEAAGAWEAHLEAGGRHLYKDRLSRMLNLKGNYCAYGGKPWEAFKSYLRILTLRPFWLGSYVNFARIFYRRPFRKKNLS